jgi:hypothetical protein
MLRHFRKRTWRWWVALGAASLAALSLLAWFARGLAELPEPDRDLRLQYEAQAQQEPIPQERPPREQARREK